MSAPVRPPSYQEEDRITLTRDASSHLLRLYADGVVTTARRSGQGRLQRPGPRGVMKEDYELSLTGGWNTLGMRGNLQHGLHAQGARRSGTGPAGAL